MHIRSSQLVIKCIREIPRGKVATYGLIADLITEMCVTPRQVGQVLATCEEEVPWHRVVGAGGVLVLSKRDPILAIEQRELLTAEGVMFTDSGLVRIDDFLWNDIDVPLISSTDGVPV